MYSSADNELSSYSNIYYKKTITFNDVLSNEDLEDFKAFININKLQIVLHYAKKYNIDSIVYFDAETYFFEKDENFYNNFQKMLFYSGYRGGLKPSKVREISELIEKFTPEQILDIYSTNPALKSMVEGYNRMKNNIGEVDEADTEDVANAIIEALLEKL